MPARPSHLDAMTTAEVLAGARARLSKLIDEMGRQRAALAAADAATLPADADPAAGLAAFDAAIAAARAAAASATEPTAP